MIGKNVNGVNFLGAFFEAAGFQRSSCVLWWDQIDVLL